MFSEENIHPFYELVKLSRSDRILTAFNAFVAQTKLDREKVKRKQKFESYKIKKIN